MEPISSDGRPGAMRVPSSRARHVPLLVVTLLVGIALAACGAQFPGGEETPIPGPMVTVETRGGECPDGACGGTVAIEWDGRIHALAPVEAEMGQLPESVRSGLERAVRTADYRELASRPFTDECPTAFDGQETIYTFATPSGPVRLASCEVEIDPADPLFVAVQGALDLFPVPGA